MTRQRPTSFAIRNTWQMAAPITKDGALAAAGVVLATIVLVSAPMSVALGAETTQQREPARSEGRSGMAEKYSGYQALIADTHRRSLAARERVLREVVARDSCWPHGVWGDTMWALAALYLNERVEEANARLLKRAKAYVSARGESGQTTFAPGHGRDTPWAYFALGDYVRMLCFFRAGSGHWPGRLESETEAAMKEALWRLVKVGSKVADASLDNLLVCLGTENHDLTKRPNYYLVASLLRDDPKFQNRRYDDGHTAAEHFAAYNAYFREWPRQRARAGLWIELGSDTYQKYSWPALLNLCELAPDPVVRKRFEMLLDLAFIEEAQVSVLGRRGGGRSRASYGGNNFESYKNLLHVPGGVPARASHSKIIETSRYQLPAAAILLRTVEFPTAQPFVIANRVLGEIDPTPSAGGRYAADSALVNSAYRTPYYILGCTLQNPALAMPHPETGEPVLKYSGISRQKRWCGLLFHDPKARHPVIPATRLRADSEMCAVYPVIEKTRGGRPQHPHWSFQHKNVMLLQRIAPQRPEHPMRMGSYSTGRINVRFHGRQLEKVEEKGWIFASNGKAFVGVRFLDYRHEWDETGEVAKPVGYERFRCTSRVLFHAGDIAAHGSFKQFRTTILSNPLLVEPDRVEYRVGPEGALIECFRYDADHHDRFTLPRVNGQTVNLRPEWTYHSPYLKGRFGENRIAVTVGPLSQIYDFGEATTK